MTKLPMPGVRRAFVGVVLLRARHELRQALGKAARWRGRDVVKETDNLSGDAAMQHLDE